VALFAAVQGNCAGAVKLLLTHGVDPNAEVDGKTALLVATEKCNYEVIDVLLANSARWDFTIWKHGSSLTILEVATKMQKQPQVLVPFIRHLGEKVVSQAGGAVTFEMMVEGGDFTSALHTLETGQVSASRTRKSAQMKTAGQLAVVGSDLKYLSELCRTIESLPKSPGVDPASLEFRGSNETFRLVLGWLIACLTCHSDCINAESSLPNLPSRIIDVGPPDGLKDPVLRELPGVRGRYVALSHRWGDISFAKLTKSNLNDRLSRIPFGSLTKVMQDAVIVTRRFGIRYLWIDALCIIQDSHSDWSKEACNMADVYRYTLFSIAADASEDHSDGFFSSLTSKKVTESVLDSRGVSIVLKWY
jgi:hypothetical protein